MMMNSLSGQIKKHKDAQAFKLLVDKGFLSADVNEECNCLIETEKWRILIEHLIRKHHVLNPDKKTYNITIVTPEDIIAYIKKQKNGVEEKRHRRHKYIKQKDRIEYIPKEHKPKYIHKPKPKDYISTKELKAIAKAKREEKIKEIITKLKTTYGKQWKKHVKYKWKASEYDL